MFGRNREDQNQQDLVALRAEVDRLGAGLRALSETLSSLGRRNLRPAAARMRDAAAAMAQTAQRKMRGTPLTGKPGIAAGIAFCIGVAAGLVLRSGGCGEAADE